MVGSLLVLNSSYVGSRDLWWVDDPDSTKGYNIYRAFDAPTNWIKLNGTPWVGHFFRDMSSLLEETYTVQPTDWIERGELGRWAFRIPEFPYSDVVTGRPVITNSVNDVTVNIDGVPYRPARVTGIDRTVYLQMDNTAAPGGAISAYPLASNGVVWQADYSGVQKFEAVYKKIQNFVDIYTSLIRTYYTVVPIGDKGELHAPGAPGSQIRNTQETETISWEFQEMVRRNAYLFEEVGEPAYLMFRKTRGEFCGCRTTGLEQPRTGCPICFGVGFVGGYYGPFDFIYVPPDSALQVELQEGGRKVTRTSRSYLGPTPIVQSGDLVIRRNGDRLVVSEVVYKQPRGVIVQQDFDTSLLPEGDTRYLIPVNTGLPTIFNPVVRANPLNWEGNGEPVVDPRTIPGKDWENPNIPIGRSVTFGKIVT